MELFDRILRNEPTATSICDANGTLTYRDLAAAVERLTESLAAAGVDQSSLVAVELPRSANCVIAWLAVWSAGAAFIGIDPSLPEARRKSYREHATHLLDRDLVITKLAGRGRPAQSVDYVFFSSGSTGQPKGAMMPSAGILPVIDTQVEAFEISKDSRVLWMLSPGFDASFSDVFTALCSGATLCIADVTDASSFVKACTTFEITHADVPPSLLPFLNFDEIPPSLNTIIVGGELCAGDVRELSARRRVVNCYGPTETTICSSMHTFSAESWDPRNIGFPIPGVIFRIEGDELLIAGPGVATGYLDGTHSKFVEYDGRTWFRTGDCVTESDEGFRFLGRIDRQFKISGKLVAPEEIETTLLSVPGVRACVVEHLNNRVVATCETDGCSDVLERANDVCRETLPVWMRPRIIVSQSIERNLHFKTSTRESDIFSRVLSEILGFSLAENDDIWECGCDSLLAMEIVARLADLGWQISLATLRECRTLGELRVSLRTVVPDIRRDEIVRHVSPNVKVSRSECTALGRCIVTGATGFLGERLVKRLLDSGEDVTCLVRGASLDTAKARVSHLIGAKVIRGDLRDKASWEGEFGSPFDTIFHFAANVDFSKSFDPVGHVSTVAALKEVAAESVRFVLASSLSVFVGTDAENASESDTSLRSFSHAYGGYAADKILSELLVRENFADPVVLRFGLIAGETTRPNTLYASIRTIAKLRCAPKAPTWRFDLTPVDFAADATIALAHERGTFHICNPSSVTLQDLIDAVESTRGESIEEISNADFSRRLARRKDSDSRLAFAGFCRAATSEVFNALRAGDLFMATDYDLGGGKTSKRLLDCGVSLTRSNREILLENVSLALRDS